MKFSIITPSLNQGKFIRDCIESVLNQNNNDFEHIIVDGESKDNTNDILSEYQHLKIICEKDTGPADAINKGFKAAIGEIIAWLNADDYYDKNVFNIINDIFENRAGAEFVYGNLTFVDLNKNILLKDVTKEFNYNSLINISPDIRQPCSFFKNTLLQKAGFINENLKIVFDYDLFIRMIKYTKPIYVNQNLSFYRDYSDTITRKNIRKQGFEIFKVSQSHGGKLFSPVTKISLKRILKGIL